MKPAPEGEGEDGANNKRKRKLLISSSEERDEEGEGGVEGPQMFHRRPPLKKAEKSLAILLQGMVGYQVLVEMKNNSEIRGYIREADDGMNLVMEEVEHITSKGDRHELEVMYIKGRMIRYVHIPQQINVGRSIQRHLNSLDVHARRFQRARLKAPPQGQPTPRAEQVIQIRLPLPAAESIRPYYVD